MERVRAFPGVRPETSPQSPQKAGTSRSRGNTVKRVDQLAECGDTYTYYYDALVRNPQDAAGRSLVHKLTNRDSWLAGTGRTLTAGVKPAGVLIISCLSEVLVGYLIV